MRGRSLHYCNKNRQNHSTQKPEVYEGMILSFSNEDDVVLDPFSGSGTLLRVGQQTGRPDIGIEVKLEYIEITKERLAMPFSGLIVLMNV